MEKIKLNIYNDSKECDEALSMSVRWEYKKPLLVFEITNEQAEKWRQQAYQYLREKRIDKMFDVDEAFETGIMSLRHLSEMTYFLYKKT